MPKLVKQAACILALSGIAVAADYKCAEATCDAQIVDPTTGNMRTHTFNRDTILSTSAGWVVDGDWTPVGS